MIKKLTIIGGGSAYTPGLLAALIHHRSALHLDEVRLYDIDQKNLDIVGRLGSRMAAVAGGPFLVSCATDLAEAVSGVDAVLNSSRPGGFDCRRIDETLPLDFAIPGQETVGPGGFFFALRSVPAALELAAAVRRHAPNALILNYTNPTNLVTQALSQYGVRVIGMCDQSDEDLFDLVKAVGGRSSWSFDCTGLNHATWYHDIRIGAVPLSTIQILEVPPHLRGEYRLRFEISCALARSHPGYWPNSYLAYYAEPGAFVEHALRNGVRTDAIVKALPSYFSHFEEEAQKDEPRLIHHRGTEGFGDMAVRVLRALDAPEVEPIVLNVPSLGATSIFREDTVVEVVCEVSASELIRRPAPPLSSDQQPLLLALERYQDGAVHAAISADETIAMEALAANPLVFSKDIAADMFESAKRRYGKRIPMFA